MSETLQVKLRNVWRRPFSCSITQKPWGERIFRRGNVERKAPIYETFSLTPGEERAVDAAWLEEPAIAGALRAGFLRNMGEVIAEDHAQDEESATHEEESQELEEEIEETPVPEEDEGE